MYTLHIYTLLVYTHTHSQADLTAVIRLSVDSVLNVARLDGWGLTALSTQFKLYHAFKVELYYKY